MRSFFTAIKTIGSGILVLVVCTVLMLMIFAAPLELAIQSCDLLQMQSTAEGKITRSEVVSNGELSRSIVEYTFSPVLFCQFLHVRWASRFGVISTGAESESAL